MTFLDRAREMPHPDKPFYTRAELAKKCWPEILDVVDAAQDLITFYSMTTDTGLGRPKDQAMVRRLDYALERLDEKAGE